MKQLLVTAALLALVILISFVAFGVPVFEGARLLFEGAFGDKIAISQSIVRATPILLTATGITIAWRAGAGLRHCRPYLPAVPQIRDFGQRR